MDSLKLFNMSRNLKNLILVTIFIIAYLERAYPITYMDPGTISTWGDQWYHIGITKLILKNSQLPKTDLVYGWLDLPYVYPPLIHIFGALFSLLSSLGLRTTYLILGPLIGALAVFPLYLFFKRITKKEGVSLFASLLAVSSPWYLCWSGGFLPQTVGFFLLPLALFFLYDGIEKKSDKSLILAGLFSGATLLFHLLTGAILFLVYLCYFILRPVVRFRKIDLGEHVRSIAIPFCLMLIVSSPWWIWILKVGYKNLLMGEMEQKHTFDWYLRGMNGINLFLGIPGLIYLFWKRREGYILNLALAIPILIMVENFRLTSILNFLIRRYPGLQKVVSPIFGERFLALLAPPLALSASLFLFTFLAPIFKVFKSKKRNLLFLPICLLIGYFIYAPISNVIFCRNPPFLRYPHNLKVPAYLCDQTVDQEEIRAAEWMKENLPEDSIILSDYFGGEVIMGVTAMKVAAGGGIRQSIPGGSIYMNFVDIYYTPNVSKALALINRYKITHLVLSERIERSGFFCLLDHPRWNYSGAGFHGEADTQKFEESECFRKMYDKEGVKVFEVLECQ